MMKKHYFHIFLLIFLFLGEKPNNSFTSDIQFFEKEKKTVTLVTSKTHFFTSKSNKYKFKKDRYFEIVPPEYQIQKMTITTYDSSIDRKSMMLYTPVTEQIAIAKGGWKWKEEKTILKNSPDNVQVFSKKRKALKYLKEKDEYATITKIVVQNTHGASRLLQDNPEEYRRKMKVAQEIIEKAKREEVIDFKECIKDGYLREIQFKDLPKQNFSDSEIIKFRKGSWTLLKPIDSESGLN